MGNEDLKLAEWIVVNSPAGRYMGKVGAGHLRDNFLETKANVIKAIDDGDHVELLPAFDFMAPMRPVPQPNGRVAMTRDPIVTPPDFTVEDMPVYVKATAVYFLGDLKEIDQKLYKELVTGAIATAESARQQARAQASGIALVGPGQAPPNLRT